MIKYAGIYWGLRGHFKQKLKNISGTIDHHTLTLMRMLLEANPEAAKYENENLIYCICQDTMGGIFKFIILNFISLNVDLLKKADSKGCLAIHYASESDDLSDIIYILTFCPESATMVDSLRWNILHYAMTDKDNDTAVVEEKINHICRQYSSLIHQRDNNG